MPIICAGACANWAERSLVIARFIHHPLPGLIEVVPERIEDERGFFSEVWQRDRFAAAGIARDWLQENHSRSARRGTLRGLHFQLPPVAQAKLVRVVRGAIHDVAVDLRRGSPGYGRWVGIELSAARWNQLFIPSGLAHGFITLTDDAEVLYKVDAPWSPEHECALRWDDPDLAIAWPDAGGAPILSPKDARARGFAGFASPFVWDGE